MKPVTELPAWAYAHGGPTGHAIMRQTPEDFVVEEDLGFGPDGEGEHVLLHIKKRNTNTEWLARQLGKLAGVRKVDVGFAGLKDRNAVTSQWFSVRLAGRDEPDWGALESADVVILQTGRHRRKIKRGALKGNRFRLVLRGLSAERSALDARLSALRERGAPNYFGEQRFGINANNLAMAAAMFGGERRERDRHKRGLYLSAARSLLFNEILSQRVREGTWDKGLPGDALMLDGRRAFFVAEDLDTETLARISKGEIHPTGPLWGRGAPAVKAEAAQVERRVLGDMEFWTDGLERAGLEMERRALRQNVEELEWSFPAQDCLEIHFRLHAGAYATAVLREVIACAA